MGDIQAVLRSAVVKTLSDQNYEQSHTFYRLWFDIGQTYFQIPSDQLFDALWNNRTTGYPKKPTHPPPPPSTSLSYYGHSRPLATFSSPAPPKFRPTPPELIHPTAHLILRFASDAESDHIFAPHSSGLQTRLCAKILPEFFDSNLTVVWHKNGGSWDDDKHYYILQGFYANINLIARWANLGYVGEAAIRNHILQSLISHPTLHDHQADALIILFKLAGATFGVYTDLSVVNRCFELLKGYHYNDLAKEELLQVSALSVKEVTLQLRQYPRR